MMTAVSTKMPSTLAEALKEKERLAGDCFLPIEETTVKADGLTVALFAVGRDQSSGTLLALGVAQDAQATCRVLCKRYSSGDWYTITLKGSGWPEEWIRQNADACFRGALRAVDVLRGLQPSRDGGHWSFVDHGQPW